jgi:hypothetical protein
MPPSIMPFPDYYEGDSTSEYKSVNPYGCCQKAFDLNLNLENENEHRTT